MMAKITEYSDDDDYDHNHDTNDENDPTYKDVMTLGPFIREKIRRVLF